MSRVLQKKNTPMPQICIAERSYSITQMICPLHQTALALSFNKYQTVETHSHFHACTHARTFSHSFSYFNHALYSFRLTHSATRWRALTNIILNFPSRYSLRFVLLTVQIRDTSSYIVAIKYYMCQSATCLAKERKRILCTTTLCTSSAVWCKK